MAITKEFLMANGVSEEAAQIIFAERGKEINEANQKQRDTEARAALLQSEVDTLKQQAAKADNDTLSAVQKELEAYKKKVSDFETEKAEAAKAAEAKAADAKLAERVKELCNGKVFSSDYVAEGVLRDIKAAKAADPDKELSTIFKEVTDNKEGIFKNPNMKLELPHGGADKNVDVDAVAKAREVMGLPPLSEK